MSEENDKIKLAVENEKLPAKRVAIEIPIDIKEEHGLDSSEVFDDTWAELSQDWQAQPTPKTDITALVARTGRSTRNGKICFGINIIATVVIILVFLYGIYNGKWGEASNTYIGLGSLLAIIFIYFETKLRLATWSQLCDSPEKAIDNAIMSSESSMKYLWITKISFLPFIPLLNWYVYTASQANDKTALPVFLMANGLIIIMYLVVDYLHNKRKKEYQKLSQIKSIKNS